MARLEESTSIVHLKVRLLGISPMIWRRVLVPASVSLRELHGILQASMGWEGIHLYYFDIHAVHYGSKTPGSSISSSLASSRLMPAGDALDDVVLMWLSAENGLSSETATSASTRRGTPSCGLSTPRGPSVEPN